MLPVFRYAPLLASQLPLILNMTSKHKSPIFLILFFSILSTYACVGVLLYRQSQHMRNKLRYWRARSAVIEEIGATPHFVDGKIDFVYWYVDNAGDTVRRTSRESPLAIQSAKLGVGDTFTLLVSPEKEADVVPYFFTTDFRVVPIEATQISSEVSTRIAAQVITQPIRPAGHLGDIEPELLDTKPRRVRLTGKTQRYIAYMIAVTTLYLPLIYLLPRFLPLGAGGNALLAMLLNVAFLCALSPVTMARSRKTLLQTGIPFRARIVSEEDLTWDSTVPLPSHTIRFTYQYERNIGRHTQTFTMNRSRAWQLGLQAGATFTLLCHANSPTQITPYFQITDVEIVGAMGAKVTPP